MAKIYDVFILCGGKCGSTSLSSSFNKFGYKTLKVHGKLDYINQFHEDKLYETIDLSCSKKPVIIIDVYRTPIERKISSFFQNINSYVPDWKSKSTEQLVTEFNNNYLYKLEEYHSINEAFENYNIPNFTEFNFQKCFNLLKKDNKFFIKLLYKDISKWQHILRLIFNKNFTITKNNLSNKKDYYTSYQHFLLKYKVPKKYLELLTKDKEFAIYNSLEDQVSYFEYWNLKSF
jgi:hypothetical protein